MNTLKKTLRIPKDRELKIKLPESFDINKKVVIMIEEEVSDDYKKKMELMKKSVNDPLFQQDMKEISDDFNPIDFETIS
ncbi:MAG: hypothetical protein ABI840_03650 [bacterium]